MRRTLLISGHISGEHVTGHISGEHVTLTTQPTAANIRPDLNTTARQQNGTAALAGDAICLADFRWAGRGITTSRRERLYLAQRSGALNGNRRSRSSGTRLSLEEPFLHPTYLTVSGPDGLIAGELLQGQSQHRSLERLDTEEDPDFRP